MPQDKRKYSDRAAYLKRAVANRRRALKEKAIEHKGGKCQICGYKKCAAALVFHHFDASQKEFGLSQRGLARSWGKIQKELEKCILLCSNCHAEVHANVVHVHTIQETDLNIRA